MPENRATPPPTDADDEDVEYIDAELAPWQMDALFNTSEYGFVALSGGRGSGKSFLDPPTVAQWLDLPKDLYFGICAPTDTMLQTVLAPIRRTIDHLGLQYTYGPQAPREWREQWEADNIAFPPARFRADRFWILEDATHIFTFSLVNNAYTRAKSLDMNVIFGQEMTEPGVYEDALTTLVGCLRCGRATPQADGSWRCVVPGHLHQLRIAFNVPLRNPSHYMFTKMKRMHQEEEARRAIKRKPYFRLIMSRTQDNPVTGASYVQMLRSAWDEVTFEEQTSGDILNSRSTSRTYYAYSESNILPTLEYHPLRDLHMWFDFNKSPASSGWGHDLLPNEVPVEDLRAKYHFGIVGEFFSGADPVDAYRHALALLDDPAADPRSQRARCMDCRDNGCNATRGEHMEHPRGFLCTKCAFSRPQPKGLPLFCSSKTVGYESSQKYIHAPSNWHGLINHRGRIYVYGDASGKNETAGSVMGSPLKILKSVFGQLRNVQFRFKEGNPPITLRELAVNVGLRAHNGTHSIFIAPWCTEHLADCEQVEPDPKTGHARKEFGTPAERAKGNGYWLRGHSLEGFGYHIDWRFPFLMPSAGGMPFAGMGGESGPLDTAWPHP